LTICNETVILQIMKSTRDRIMQTLLRQPRTTINELAVAVGINPISVRHHLTNLQVEGLVATEEERHGVGRPRLVYFLTEAGTERFPTRYLRLTTRLLAQMKESMPEPVVSKLFAQMADGLAEEYASQMKGLNMEERLDLAKTLLTEEGFDIQWEKTGSQYQIHEITCPYLQIGLSHPEVCTVDQTLISRMLAVPAEKVQCLLQGDAHCTYVVQAEAGTK
jgi:DeoR family transcriptional regulator, suf operon transcriptional repressor